MLGFLILIPTHTTLQQRSDTALRKIKICKQLQSPCIIFYCRYAFGFNALCKLSLVKRQISCLVIIKITYLQTISHKCRLMETILSHICFRQCGTTRVSVWDYKLRSGVNIRVYNICHCHEVNHHRSLGNTETNRPDGWNMISSDHNIKLKTLTDDKPTNKSFNPNIYTLKLA